MEATNLQETRYLYNTNRMLYDNLHTVTVNGQVRGCKYEGVTGIKTGYTSQARGCLVAGAKTGRNGTHRGYHGLYGHGAVPGLHYSSRLRFENYKTVNVLESGNDLGTVPVHRGSVKRVKVILPNEVHATCLPSLLIVCSGQRLSCLIPWKLRRARTKAGTVKLYVGEELIGEYDAVTAEFVDKGLAVLYRNRRQYGRKDSKVVIYSVVVLLLLLVMYILVKRHQVKVRRIRNSSVRRSTDG